MSRSSHFRWSLMLLIVVLPGSGFSSEAAVPWSQGNHVIVELSSSVEAGTGRYELWVSGPGDVRVAVAERSGGRERQGSLILVGGRFLAVHGLDVQPGMEIDAMDIPVLTWQLAAQLLERVMPGGPGPSIPNKEIKISERSNGIEVGTMSAGAQYGAPWTATATLSRDDVGPVHYRLDSRYTDSESGKLSTPMNFSGSWEHQQPQPEVPDTLSLTGWKLFSIGPVTRTTKDGQVLDYSSASLEKTARSVGDLRKLAQSHR